MSLAPLHPIRDYHSYVRGDVLIDPSVAIAPGVILQAEAGSQIAIAPGACIGMGSVIHAIKGKIEIGEGVILGAGVLVVGNVSIGANACIGSATTIVNTEIARGQILPPGVLIGDQSRQVDLDLEPDLKPISSGYVDSDSPAASENSPASVTQSPDSTQQSQTPTSVPEKKPVPDAEISDQPEIPEIVVPPKTSPQVYGKTYINQLLVTMLPHRQPLHPSSPDDES